MMRLIALSLATLLTPFAGQSEPSVQTRDIVYHILLHELAHALVGQFDLPILGDEEVAADNFAALLLYTTGDKHADRIALHASGFFAARYLREGPGPSLASRHTHNLRRAARIACLAAGYDQQPGGPLAEWAELVEEEQDHCASDAAQNDSAWTGLLAKHRRGTGETPTDILIDLTDMPLAQDLAEAGVFDDFADVLRLFRWPETNIPPRISVAVEACNNGAFWVNSRRRLVMCEGYLSYIVSLPARPAVFSDAWQ